MSTVLIVDDEPKMRELLTRWLAPDGYELKEAADGGEALEIVRSGGIDVVVSDVAMPGNDGLWLVAHLRSQFPKVGIVLATAVNEIPGTITLQSGVVGYLLKPLTAPKVRESVTRALEWRRAALERPAATADASDAFDEWLRGKLR